MAARPPDTPWWSTWRRPERRCIAIPQVASPPRRRPTPRPPARPRSQPSVEARHLPGLDVSAIPPGGNTDPRAGHKPCMAREDQRVDRDRDYFESLYREYYGRVLLFAIRRTDPQTAREGARLALHGRPQHDQQRTARTSPANPAR